MLSNPSDAEDVFQESFVIAFCKLHQLKALDQFGGWLKKIVINECIKKCKSSINWNELKEDLTLKSKKGFGLKKYAVKFTTK